MRTLHSIGTLVTRIQGAFLDKPSLKLTLPQAVMRFGADAVACDAVLELLVDSGVLARSADGAYVRAVATRFAPEHHAA